MRLKTKILLSINKLFPLPVHPFNLQNQGSKTYAEWQFEKGIHTIEFFLKYATTEEMFHDKIVLDIGCGAGGKTIFYASKGVRKIYGLELLNKYREEAAELAIKKGFADKFEFICKDAADTGFEENYFDTIIMNDAMEHVDDPQAVLRECLRILKPNGRIFINFPPYHHPFGAHLSDAIAIPWVHRFFSEKTMIEAYKELVKELPDGEGRIEFRISRREDGTEYFSYINKMTIKRFRKILMELNAQTAECIYYHEVPLRKFLKVFSKLPFFKEMFVKMVVVVLKPG